MSSYRTDSVSKKFNWIIKGLNPFSYKEYENHARYYTNDFNIFFNEIATKWRFVLHFEKTWIGLFLQKIEASSNDFDVIMHVTAQLGDTENYKINEILRKAAGEISNECGWPKLIWTFIFINIYHERKRDYEFDFNHDFTFNIEVTLCENKKSGSNPDVNLNENELSKYKTLHNSDELSDFAFICSDGLKIPAHREILTVSSPVIQTMLNAPMSENNTQIAQVDDIDGETMIEVLRYMYQKNVENVDKLALKLLYAAEKYDIEGLKDHCASSIAETLSTNNVVEYLLTAEQYNAKELLMSCINYPSNQIRNAAKLKQNVLNVFICTVTI